MCGFYGDLRVSPDWEKAHADFCAQYNLHPVTLMPLDGSEPKPFEPYKPSQPPKIDWLAINREVSD